jgi:hypothetical protein
MIDEGDIRVLEVDPMRVLRIRLQTLMIGIAFLAIILKAIIQSVRLLLDAANC